MSKLKRKQSALHKSASALTKSRHRIVKSKKFNKNGKTPVFKQKPSSSKAYQNKSKNHVRYVRNDSAIKQYGWRGTQLQFRLTRTKFSDGKYRRIVTLERGKRQYHNQNGLLHSLYYERERIVGDKPSITKSLQGWKPASKRGKLVKGAAVASNYIVHEGTKGVVDVALGSETAAIETGKYAARSAADRFKQKYKSDASDDVHKGTFFVAKSAFDAGRGIHQHFRMKSQYKNEISSYKLKTQERKGLQKKYSALKSDRKADKQELTRTRRQYKQQEKQDRKQAKKNGSKYTPGKKTLAFKANYQNQKQKYRYAKGMTQIKKTELKIKTQQKHAQNRIRRLSAPSPLILKPAAYYGRQLRASAWQKAVSEDENNDFMQVVKFGKEHITDKVIQKNTPYHRLRKQEISRDKLIDKHAKQQSKLQLKENKLHNTRNAARKKTKRKIKRSKKSTVTQHVKNFFKKMVGSTVRSKGIAAAAIVAVGVIVLTSLLLMVLSAFSSLFSGSGYVMGTFPSQDYYLTQAEEYYTKLAWDLNEQILRINADHWKDALKELGVDASGMKDKPDEFIWGNSSVYPYDPAYDFDRYKLWSFLCAYYYEYDEEKQDMKYWEYDGDTEALLTEIFNAEYEFTCYYDNTSHWQERREYVYFGYALIEGSSTNRPMGNITISNPEWMPGEVKAFFNGNVLYYNYENGEILNYNDNYSATGWYFQNQFVNTRDPAGNVYNGYYQNGETCTYGKRDENDNLVLPCYYVIPEENWISFLKKYDWVTDCRLYYNVKQKKTFDEVIEEKLKEFENGDERLQYYHLLVGDEDKNLYGNHQIFRDMFDSSNSSIQNKVSAGSLINGYGWDVQGWNTAHCSLEDLHEGIDIACATNTSLYAPMECEVKSYDPDKHMIVLRQEKVHFWYDGDGKGKDRDTEITIGNADLVSGIEVGDMLSESQEFALTSSQQCCDDLENPMGSYVHIKVKIYTDGIGWGYIDPLLVFY